MEKFNGNSNRNARIKIDYRGIKPKVSFSYPNVKEYTSGSMFFIIFFIWLIPIIFLFIIYMIISYILNVKIFSSVYIFGKIFECFILFYILTLPPLLIYLPLKKYWSNIYPKFNAKLVYFFSQKYYIKFSTKDFLYKNKKYYLEVPLFENVILEYDAEEEFSKYLSYIEVKEYPIEIRKLKKGKISSNKLDTFWYARFYYYKKPSRGYLDVMFI